MTFTTPIPFKEAVEQLAARSLLPTGAGSRQIMDDLDAQIRERAWFSARVTETRFLSKMAEVVTRVTSPATDQAAGEQRINKATARLMLKEQLKAIGWTPQGNGVEPGSLQDLTSDGRLNLIIETNTQMAQGYGDWAAGQDPDILDAFPCQELIRVVDAEEPRDWLSRWTEAGGQLYDARMIAPKNDPIWTAISAFGLPYPPFDFNSGMDVQDVGYREAVELGVIERGQRIEPAETGFDRDVRAKAPESDSLLLDLVKAFPDRLRADGEQIVLHSSVKSADIADRVRERNRKKAPLPEAEQREIIQDVVKRAQDKDDNDGEDFGAVSSAAVEKAKAAGVDLEGYTKRVDPGFVRHALQQHGDSATEAPRGQVAISPQDFAKLPAILDKPHAIQIQEEVGPQGEKRLLFGAPPQDNHQLIVEVRVGRRRLVPVTMWKAKPA